MPEWKVGDEARTPILRLRCRIIEIDEEHQIVRVEQLENHPELKWLKGQIGLYSLDDLRRDSLPDLNKGECHAE